MGGRKATTSTGTVVPIDEKNKTSFSLIFGALLPLALLLEFLKPDFFVFVVVVSQASASGMQAWGLRECHLVQLR